MSIVLPTLSLSSREWLEKNEYFHPSFVARGRSAGIWKVEKNGKFFAAKIEHWKSRRAGMIEKEARLLHMANTVGVGPRLIEWDARANILVMEFIEGVPFAVFLKTCASKKQMEKAVRALAAQAQALDAGGIDHGQLGGKLHNILVDKKSRVWIIDFEKASYVRKTRNVSKLRDVLFNTRTVHSQKILSVWKNAPTALGL